MAVLSYSNDCAGRGPYGSGTSAYIFESEAPYGGIMTYLAISPAYRVYPSPQGANRYVVPPVAWCAFGGRDGTLRNWDANPLNPNVSYGINGLFGGNWPALETRTEPIAKVRNPSGRYLCGDAGLTPVIGGTNSGIPYQRTMIGFRHPKVKTNIGFVDGHVLEMEYNKVSSAYTNTITDPTNFWCKH